MGHGARVSVYTEDRRPQSEWESFATLDPCSLRRASWLLFGGDRGQITLQTFDRSRDWCSSRSLSAGRVRGPAPESIHGSEALALQRLRCCQGSGYRLQQANHAPKLAPAKPRNTMNRHATLWPHSLGDDPLAARGPAATFPAWLISRAGSGEVGCDRAGLR